MMGYGHDTGPWWFVGMLLFGIVAVLAFVWTVSIKGYALWHAAKRNEKWWFIALLVINTFGIFELFYLIVVAKVLFNKKQSHLMAHHVAEQTTHSEHSVHHPHHHDPQK